MLLDFGAKHKPHCIMSSTPRTYSGVITEVTSLIYLCLSPPAWGGAERPAPWPCMSAYLGQRRCRDSHYLGAFFPVQFKKFCQHPQAFPDTDFILVKKYGVDVVKNNGQLECYKHGSVLGGWAKSLRLHKESLSLQRKITWRLTLTYKYSRRICQVDIKL